MAKSEREIGSVITKLATVATAVGLAAIVGGKPASADDPRLAYDRGYPQCGGTVGLEDHPAGRVVFVHVIRDRRTGEQLFVHQPLDASCSTGPEIRTSGEVDHWNRLDELDVIFRRDGVEAWLRAAGFQWRSLSSIGARQVEEETSPRGRILASGIQVAVDGLRTPWPTCLTTDQPVTSGPNTRSHQPDPRNPSMIWVEVPNFSGRATLYVDCSNWQQLRP